MPAQGLIRNLSKAQVDAEITKARAGDLLEVEQNGTQLLLKCKPHEDKIHSVDGSPEALQAILDIDAKITREKADALKAAEKAETEAKRAETKRAKAGG